MKLFSLILSVLAFFVALFFLVVKIPDINCLNDIIYVSLLILLMLICLVGVAINWEFFEIRKQKRLVLFMADDVRKLKNKLQ